MARILRPLLGGLALAAAAATGCSRAPSEPPTSTASDAGASAAADAGPDNFHARPRDAKGNLIPKTAPPPLTDADVAPVGSHQPDWDLDETDRARDYVERYIQSTRRYGDETACVHAQASRTSGGRTLVEARDGQGEGCKGTDAVRDTFTVDVEKDRLALADPKQGKPLGPWPDGSDPGGAPGVSPQEGDISQSPLREKLRAMQLVPLRLQRYGRGSYQVVSIAGWHADLTRDASAAQLDDVARRLCAISKGPMGIFAGLDRKNILRIRCPGQGRFEQL